MQTIETIGASWLAARIGDISPAVERSGVVDYVEKHRYLPQSVSRYSGYIDYSLTPYWREILECFHPDSDVREVAVMKGVQVAYTTTLESLILYYSTHIRTIPCMFVTADRDLAEARVDKNFLPMFNDSGFGDIFTASEGEDARKTGKTRRALRWRGGGFLAINGARNADKARMESIQLMLMDEIDAWRDLVSGGGDPVRLFRDRCAAYWGARKILYGSTPLLKGSSRIEREYLRGDQRKYFVRCLNCGEPQVMRWSGRNEDGKEYGFTWETTGDGALLTESVRYVCCKCGHGHVEEDKPALFAEGNAEWRPTATPVEPGIRSYHIPALLSPLGMQPWSKCVSMWLEAYDPELRRVRDHLALQIFYNNVLGEPWEQRGEKVTFSAVSSLRRPEYRRGEIPQSWLTGRAGSGVAVLVVTADVHKDNIAVGVWGWTTNHVCVCIEYERIYADDCTHIDSPAWNRLREIIEGEYTTDTGETLRPLITLVDAGFETSTVTTFCDEYLSVYPILGRDSSQKPASIREFREFTTQGGKRGYQVIVEYYKERLAPALRREYDPASGDIPSYSVLFPVDMRDDELKELTREYKREKQLQNGTITYEWYRPSGAKNELWDLAVYAQAAIEILAHQVCVEYMKLDFVDWEAFWDAAADATNSSK